MPGKLLHVAQTAARLDDLVRGPGDEGAPPRMAASADVACVLVYSLEPVCDAIGAIATPFRKDHRLP